MAIQLDKLDETDSTIQTKVTFTAVTSSTTDTVESADEEPIQVRRALNTEALQSQQRVALTETLSRCLPSQNSTVSRLIAASVIIAIIVTLEVILASDYKTLKVLSQALINTLTSNESAEARIERGRMECTRCDGTPAA